MHTSIREEGSPAPSFSLDARDVVIQAGLVFQFEPNAAFGREYGDVGGNRIVTEDGCEALNVLPMEMRRIREVEVERESCVPSGDLSINFKTGGNNV